jgi:hypothetical protein
MATMANRILARPLERDVCGGLRDAADRFAGIATLGGFAN